MINTKDVSEKLLSDRRVVDEIKRHLWVESEKAGRDIGFESAKVDWLKNFSKAWMEYHMPKELTKLRKTSKRKTKPTAVRTRKTVSARKRRAKSYL